MHQTRKSAWSKSTLAFLCILVVIIVCPGFVARGQTGPIPGVFVVKLAKGVRQTAVAQALRSGQHLDRVTSAVSDRAIGAEIWDQYYRLVTTDSNLTADDVRRELGEANVEHVEPEYWLEFFDVPTDSLFVHQWYLHNTGQSYYGINRKLGTNNDELILKTGIPGMDMGRYPLYASAPPASTKVIVAIVDTGVDPTHPELQGQFWKNPDEIPRNGIDDDHNGFIDDTLGYDVSGDVSSITNIVGDNDPTDRHGHGTHCAGIVAAAANSVGIVGIAPEAKIMAVKIRPNATTAVGAAGIIYAVNAGAQIINVSWGTPFESVILADAMDYAYRNGVIVAVAAGNTGDNSRWYPAAIPTAFTVAAGDSKGNLTYFSTFGAHIDIVSPGLDILSLRAKGTDMYASAGEPGVRIIGPDSLYYLSDGTSMAAPAVCGAAAVILGQRPDLSPDRVESLLRAGAVDMIDPLATGAYLPGPDTFSGAGYINIANALDLLQNGGVYFVSPQKASRQIGPVTVKIAPTAGYGGRWKLEYSSSAAPEFWQTIAEGNVPPADSVAVIFNHPELAGLVTLRLTDSLDDQTTLIFKYVPNRQAAIIAPTTGQQFNFHIPIYANVYGPDIDSVVLDFESDAVSRSRLFSSTGEYFDSLIYSWEASGVSADNYRVILTAYFDAETLADTVTIFLNSAFASGWPQPLTGRGALSPVVADLDHDGVKEVIVGTAQGVNVFHGDGRAVDGFPVLFDTDCRSIPAVYDIDHDGIDDIIFSASDGLHAIKYDGSSVAGWPIALTIKPNGLGYATVSVGQLNPSADSVVMFIDSDGNVRAYQFDGRPYFYSLGGWFSAINPYTTPNYYWGGNTVVTADLNGDGYNEVIATYSSLIPKAGVAIFDSRTGQPAFKAASAIQIEALGVFGSALADLTGDHLPEVIMSGYDSAGVRTIWAKTLGRFDAPGFPIKLPAIDGWRGSQPTVADLDNDGSPEILCSFFEYDVAALYVFRADGTPFVPRDGRPYGEAVRTGVTFGNPIAADLTGDGRPEVILRSGHILPGTGSEKLYIYDQNLQLLPGWPVATPAEPRAVFSTPYSPLVDDIDGDGKVELALVSEAGNVCVWDFPGSSFGGKNTGRIYVDNRNSTNYIWPGIPTGVDGHDTPLPKMFALEQNYPNPFNPSTEIGFSLSERRHVTLSVYNVLGQQVTTLVNEDRQAGHHVVTWDGSGLASGIYLYKLQAGDFTATRKMVLVK